MDNLGLTVKIPKEDAIVAALLKGVDDETE